MARINYHTTSTGVALYWERYEPASGGPTWPAAIAIHGGGYSGGFPKKAIAADLADAGFLAFAIEYRLAPPHREMNVTEGHESPGQDTVSDDGHYPEQTNDVAKAIQLARADPMCNGLVYCLGGSAGGSHSAFMMATGIPGDTRPDLAVIFSCGVSNLGDPNMLALAEIPGETNPHGACCNYVGITDTWPTYSAPDLATLTAASPVTYMVGIQPPCWVLMASKDSLAIPTSSGIVGQSDQGPPETNVENGLVPKLLAVGMTESTAEVPEIGKFKKTVVPVANHTHGFNLWNAPFDGNGPPTVGQMAIAWLLSSPIVPPPIPPEIEPTGYHLTLTGGAYTVIDPIPPEYTQIQITDLEPAKDYQARLVAFNVFGESPAATYSFRTAPAVTPTLKDQPRGIFALLPAAPIIPPDTSGLPLWGYSYVAGTRARTAWQIIEQIEGSPDWDAIDALLDVAVTNDKLVGLSIAAGTSTPQYVYDAGARPVITGLPDPGTLPMPWDPVYQAKWGAFVRALGDRYDAHPNLAYVVVGGIGKIIEWTLVGADDTALGTAEAQLAGYPDLPTAWKTGAGVMLSYFISAFPTTRVIGSITRPFVQIVDNDEAMQDFVSESAMQYSDHIGFMGTGLTPTSTDTYVPNRLVKENSPLHPAGQQFAHIAPTHADFDATMVSGVALLMKYVEPYAMNYNSTDPADITTMEDTVTAMALLP